MASSKKMFQYQELRPGEFRLLRVHSKKMSTISCEMFHAPLANAPPYIAISYTWGDPRVTRLIKVDAVELAVTTSLYGALDALRSPREDVTLWADALCINQQDLEERSSQVKEMARIYANAASVGVWLGPEADGSALAVQLLERVAKGQKVSRLLQNHHQLAALVTLFERPYFARLWVVQEILNATTVNVYCGSSTLPWKVYKDANNVFRQHESFIAHRFIDTSRTTQRSFSDVLAWCGPGSFPDPEGLKRGLLWVLRTCREKLASDPRDKVFGILGVCPGIPTELSPDYSRPVREVYVDVVDHLLATTMRMDVVCEAIRNPNAATDLPSWVPDWSHLPPTSSLGLSYKFDATPGTEVQYTFSDERCRLTIGALELGTIMDHSVPVGVVCRPDDFLMGFTHSRAMLARRGLAGAAAHEALCNALCLGQVPHQYKSNWRASCYEAFSLKLQEHLPTIQVDDELQSYRRTTGVRMTRESQDRIVQDVCGKRMMGRCVCIIAENVIGMGTWLMSPGDTVVIPLGCYTPVVLRRCGPLWRFIGDVFVDGYMSGEILRHGKKTGKFELC
ncbi:heterokaryon incompatibility protein-domain-containing protein [Immersiella caudata]|uniref:Heterokaryon incompatibility protein-domain-containing protein n=1 Tax=Immersiella caudata TaxID=314043 RepID=A0AA39X5A1_9PEZI|nr:heterokaryon incompatibility protein-domain-containing protein [Immersiella caudata]